MNVLTAIAFEPITVSKYLEAKTFHCLKAYSEVASVARGYAPDCRPERAGPSGDGRVFGTIVFERRKVDATRNGIRLELEIDATIGRRPDTEAYWLPVSSSTRETADFVLF